MLQPSAAATLVLMLLAGAAGGTQTPEPSLQSRLDAAIALIQRSDYTHALPAFRETLAAGEAVHDDGVVGKSLRGIATALWGTGDYKTAIEIHTRAIELARRIGDDYLERVSLNGIGLCAYSLGEYDRALEWYDKARAAGERAKDLEFLGLVDANIGLVHRYKGRYGEAVAAFEKSLDERRRANDAAGVAQTLNHLGIVARATGEYDKAIAYYNQSLAERHRLGDAQGEAQTLNNRANVYLDFGDTERAVADYTESGAIAQRIGYSVQIALANSNLGEVLDTLGRPREALAREEAALAVYRQLSRRTQIADVLRGVGLIRLELGDRSGARAALDESLAVAREIGEPEAEARTLAALGEWELAGGDAPAAIARYDAAETIVRGRSMLDWEHEILAGRGAAYLHAGRFRDAVADLKASVAVINSLRSRLSSDSSKIGYLERRERVFGDLVDALVADGRADEALEAAESGRARALADLLSARELAQPDAGGELASLGSVDSVTAAEIRSIAATHGITLVEYRITRQAVRMWVVSADDIRMAAAPVPPDRVLAAVASVRAATEAHRLPDRTALRQLRRWLVDPIEPMLPTSADQVVTIVPQGALTSLPFAALPDAAGSVLAARHTLAFVPSASVFRYTSEKLRNAAALAQSRMLVVADPNPLPEGSGLAPLPGARREAAGIASTFGPTNAQQLVGAAATEAAFKSAAPRFDVLHVAAHSLISRDRPARSSIALAPDGGEDGYLTLSEIFGLKLRARLVVLSGCSTAAGRLSTDGVYGFTRGFILAGTPTVVATLWDVNDRAAAVVMRRFYRELRAGHAPAVALRRAQLSARAAQIDARAWAAFVLVGEPGP